MVLLQNCRGNDPTLCWKLWTPSKRRFRSLWVSLWSSAQATDTTTGEMGLQIAPSFDGVDLLWWWWRRHQKLHLLLAHGTTLLRAAPKHVRAAMHPENDESRAMDSIKLALMKVHHHGVTHYIDLPKSNKRKREEVVFEDEAEELDHEMGDFEADPMQDRWQIDGKLVMMEGNAITLCAGPALW